MHTLTNDQWRTFFLTCVERLPPGPHIPEPMPGMSWCSFTSFSRLADNAGYWTLGLPRLQDIGERGINDGGVWGQPFPYGDIAHIVIPREFWWERSYEGPWEGGTESQDIEGLSVALSAKEIEHRLTALVLEIKCY